VLPGDVAKLQVEESAVVGPVVADRDHYTLYFHEKDGTNPPSSVCLEAECTLVWVPLLAAGGQFDAPGLDPKLLSTFKRPDGVEQVAIGGHPVYRYVDDEQAGDTAGHGVDGRFAIAPNGSKASR
jgi:predicted lipoprotein with Yx(FWY)xxD motif